MMMHVEHTIQIVKSNSKPRCDSQVFVAIVMRTYLRDVVMPMYNLIVYSDTEANLGLQQHPRWNAL